MTLFEILGLKIKTVIAGAEFAVKRELFVSIIHRKSDMDKPFKNAFNSFMI